MCWPVSWSCRGLSIPGEVWTGRRCAGTPASGTCGSWYGGSCWRWPRSATGGGRHSAAPVAIDEVTPAHRARQPGLVAGGLAGGPFMLQADATIVNVARLVKFLAGQLAPAADAELAVGVREMCLHGVDRQVELLADLPVGAPGPGEAGDGFLLRAELPGRDTAGAAAGAAELGEGLVGVPAGAAGLCVVQGVGEDLAGLVTLAAAGQDSSVRGERPALGQRHRHAAQKAKVLGEGGFGGLKVAFVGG